MSRFLFPRWSNALLPTIIIVGAIMPLYAVMFVAWGFSPKTLEVGYQPEQPVPYSHALHAGELGIDCRYCHNTVERSSHAAVPPTQTCMNCHFSIRKSSPNLTQVWDSYETGMPIEWVRVNKIGDYAYFSHEAHVNRGVGCVSCHGRVDKMEKVYQAEPLSMGWCLDCHRDPVRNIRPIDKIVDLGWNQQAEMTVDQQMDLIKQYDIHPSENCSTCHR